MDKYEKRRLGLIKLRDQQCDGKAVTLASRIERPADYVSRMLYVPGKKNKKRIGDDMVEVIEKAFKLRRGGLEELAESDMAVSAITQGQVVSEPAVSDRDVDTEINQLIRDVYARRKQLGSAGILVLQEILADAQRDALASLKPGSDSNTK